MHAQCEFKIKRISDCQELIQRSNVLIRIFDSVQAYANEFGLLNAIHGFEEELTQLKDSVYEYKERITQAIENGLVWQFTPLLEQGIQIKHQIDTGYLFRQFSIYKTNRDI